MSVQAYVYSNIYDKSMKKPHIQECLNSLIGLFTSTRIIDMPPQKISKLIKLLKIVFFSDISNEQVGPNAIYRDFLMKLETLVENNKLTYSELDALHYNLQYIEEASITGLIPYPTNPKEFISNTSVVILIQDKLKEKNIPTTSTIEAVSFDTVIEHLNKLVRPTYYGKVTQTQKGSPKKPYTGLPPCPYGSKCYRQKNPKHTAEFSHPLKGGKRTSKCFRQTLKKYTSRSSPPYLAQECPYKKKKGNDGRMYVSKPNNTNGMFRWVPQ
jgi:hypothetical protein